MEKIVDDEQKSEKDRSRSRSRSRSGSKEKENRSHNKGIKNFDKLLEYFKESRKEFLFKVSFEDGFFYGKNARNYLLSILNRKLSDDGGKVIEEKRISILKPKEGEFFYFKVNKEICVRQVYIQSTKKEGLPVMKVQQMIPQSFLDDI